MTWLELFRTKNFKTAFASRRNGNKHMNPILQAKARRHIRYLFESVNLPFIYREKSIIGGNNMNSPYHNVPKGIAKRETALLKRYAKVRIGLFNSMEKEHKYRQEIVNKRKYTGLCDLLKKVMPFVVKQQSNKNKGEGGSRKGKLVSESIKGVPKAHSSARRSTKEQMKELMDSELVDTSLLNANKNEEANKRNQKKVEDDKTKTKKKPITKAEEVELIKKMEEDNKV
jgi:hypothetical protein